MFASHFYVISPLRPSRVQQLSHVFRVFFCYRCQVSFLSFFFLEFFCDALPPGPFVTAPRDLSSVGARTPFVPSVPSGRPPIRTLSLPSEYRYPSSLADRPPPSCLPAPSEPDGTFHPNLDSELRHCRQAPGGPDRTFHAYLKPLGKGGGARLISIGLANTDGL